MKTKPLYFLFWKVILMGFVLTFTSTKTSAQITNYAFTTATGTFTALSTPSATSGWSGNTDDGTSGLIPIGFDFWYMGTRYTNVSASTNGWLALGVVQSADELTNDLPGGGSPRPVIAPLWDDLDVVAFTNVTYKTTGSVPNRIFTVQYLNAKWQYNSIGSTNSFQVKFYETTGKIEFIYRTELGVSILPTASVGITSTATGSGNFLSVNNAGTSVSSTVEASVTTKPVSGKTYTFTPPVPTAPTSLTFTSVTTTSMTLNWTDNSGGVEDGFVIYKSTDGGTTYNFVSQVAANTTSSAQSGLTVSTTYFWKVYAVSEGGLSTALSGTQATIGLVTKTFTGTGNFSDAARWTGGILPVAGENLVIDGTCTVDNNIGTDSISYGTLIIGTTTARTLNWIASGTNRLSVTDVSAGAAASTLDMTNGGVVIIRGTWTSTNLTFTPGAGTINVRSTITLPAVYPIYNNLYVNAVGVTVKLGVATMVAGILRITTGILDANNFNLTVGGDWINNSSINAFTAGTATVTFNGSGAELIDGSFATTFNNLTIAGSNIVSLDINASISSNLLISSGTLALLGFTANRATAGGTFTVSNGATLKIGGTNTIPSSYTAHSIGATSTIEYSGSNQSLAVLNSTQDYGHLTISGSGTKTMAASENVRGVLTFTASTITTGANTLYLTSTGSVSRTSGHVIGNFQKYMATGVTSKTFEIGDAGNYTPVTVDFASITTAGNLTIATAAGDHANIGSSTIDAAKSANRTWTLSNSGIVFTTYNVTFTFVAGDLDGGATPGNFIAGRYQAGWTYPTIGTRTSTSTQATGLTAVQAFQLGEIVCIPTAISQIPATNLILNYRFNGNANNETGSNNGTLQAAPTLTTNRFGIASSAYTFNGTTQYVSTATSYVNPGTISVSIWFKTSTSIGGVLVGFSSVQTGTGGSRDRFIYMTSTGILYFGVAPGAVKKSVNTTASYNDGNWHLATGTLGTTGGLKLYVDGNLQASDGTVTSAESYTGYWRIGHNDIATWPNAPTSYFFSGILDDALIYHRELTPAEVTTLYNSPDGAGGNTPVCAGSSLNLTATTISGASYAWTGPNGFTSSSQNPTLTYTSAAAGLYTVVVTSGSCTYTAYKNITTAATSSTISYAGSPYCITGGTASVTFAGTAGGTYSSTAGLFINASTGAVTLGTSTAGTYTVTYTVSGGCTATASITVTAVPAATISYAGSPYYVSGGTASVLFSGTSGGTYSSTAGLSINTTTGDVTLGTSTPATYTVTYTVAAAGGCSIYTTTTSITVVSNTKTWDGGAGTNNWGDAANWNADGIPTSSDNVDLTGANTININVAATTNNLLLNNAALILTISSGNALTVSGNFTLTSGTFNTAAAFPTVSGTVNVGNGTVGFTGSGTQTIPAYNYNNLTSSSTGSRTLAASGTIGIAGTFTPGTNTYTITGSTINYNAAGVQTVAAFNYNNLVLSNAGVKTFASGTSGIASTLSITGSATANTTTNSSTISYNGSTNQTITTITYYGLNVSSTGGTVTGINTTITDFSINSGTLDLNTFTLSVTGTATYTAGTINNGTVTSTGATTTFAGTVFGAIVNATSNLLNLNGSTFNNVVTLTKNGATNATSVGGNTFNNTTTIANSGTAYLILANTVADNFVGNVTFNNTGTNALYIAFNSPGNQFSGNVTFNNTGIGSTILSNFGGAATGTVYSGNIVVNNTSATGGIYFGAAGGSCTLAATKTISVGGTGFSTGSLFLYGFNQTGTTSQALTFTGNAILRMGPATTFNGNVNFVVPQILLDGGVTFNGTTYIEKKGATQNNSFGGNVFNGATTLVNSSSSSTAHFVLGYPTGIDVFNGDLTLSNTGAAGIYPAYNTAGHQFNGNIILNETAGIGIYFCIGTGTATLATGKTISVGGSGFSTGALYLMKLTQVGTTAQTLTLTGTTVLLLGAGSTFNGNVNFTAPQLLLNGSTYNGTASLTKNGATNNISDGGNTFNSSAIITNSGTGLMRLGNTTADDFNSDATFIQTGAGLLQPAYATNCTIAGNLSTTGTATTISFGSTVTFNGAGTQSITGTETIFNNLTAANSSGIIAGNITINGILNLLSANPSATTGVLSMGLNTLNMGATATTTGQGDVTGIVRRTTILPNTDYTYGNQFTSVTFQNVGTIPSELSLKIVIGAAPGWKANAINRIYDIAYKTGTGFLATARFHYLDSELNGNTESQLVFFRYIVPLAQLIENGRTDFNTTDNWVDFSGVTRTTPDSLNFGTLLWTLSNQVSANSVWVGTVSNTWQDNLNWTGGIPGPTANAVIPDGATTDYDPLLPDSTTIKTLTIASGGILTGGTGRLFLAGAEGAWLSNGIFYYDTSTVIFTNASSTMGGTANFYNITINAGAGLTMSNQDMKIFGTITNNGTWNVSFSQNTIEYAGINQVVINPNGGSGGYHNLKLRGSGTKTMPITALSINGDFIILDALSVSAGSSLTIGHMLTLETGTHFNAGTFDHSLKGNWNNSGTFIPGSNTITFNGDSAQIIEGSTVTNFNNLVISKTSNTVTANINSTIAGNLSVTSGTFDMGSNTVNRSTAGGTLTVSNGAILKIGSTNTLPSNYSTHLTGATSTIEYSGTNQSVAVLNSSQNYGNLIVSGSGTKTNAGNLGVSNNVTVIAGTLDINTYTLKIGGSISSSGTFIASNGTIEMNGTSAQTIPASIFSGNAVKGLTINNTTDVTLGGALSLTDVLTVSNGSIATGGYLTLKSTATATARVARITSAAGIPIIGNVTVERYVPGRRKYRLITSAVTTHANTVLTSGQEAFSIWGNWQNSGVNTTPNVGNLITGGSSANGFDQGTSNASLFTYNDVSKSFVGYTTANGKNTKYTSLKAGIAYLMFVYGDRLNSVFATSPHNTVLIEKGELKTGDQAYNTSSSIPLSGVTGRYTLLGNPFASPINWATIPRADVADTYWGWDPNLSNTGGYVTVSTLGGVTITSPYSGSTGLNQYIQSGQGFFVKTSGASPVMNIREQDKVSNFNATAFRGPGEPLPLLAINLQYKSGLSKILADGVVAAFDEEFSNGIGIEDASKMVNTAEGLAITNTGELLSIDARKMPVSNDTIFLNISKLTKPQYTLQIFAKEMEGSTVETFLQDRYLNTLQRILTNDTTTVDFNVDPLVAASFDVNRFRILFHSTLILPVKFVSVKATQQNKEILVKWSIAEESEISKYEIERSADGINFSNVGQVISKGTNNSESYEWLDMAPMINHNYYRIRAIETNGTYILSKTVLVNSPVNVPEIRVYPNPVRNGQIHLYIIAREKVQYTVTLSDAAGRQISNQRIDHPGGSFHHIIGVNKLLAGVYYLQITNKNNKYVQSIMIE